MHIINNQDSKIQLRPTMLGKKKWPGVKMHVIEININISQGKMSKVLYVNGCRRMKTKIWVD